MATPPTIDDAIAQSEALTVTLQAIKAGPTPTPTPTPPADLASTVAHDADLRSNPHILQYVQWSSNAQVLADLAKSDWMETTKRPWFSPSTVSPGFQGAGSTFLCTEPEYFTDRGLNLMRASSNNLGVQQCRMIDAWLWVAKNQRKASCRFVWIRDPDMDAGFTEKGFKLSGPTADSGQVISPPLNGTAFYDIAWMGPPAGSQGHPPNWVGDYATIQSTNYYGLSFRVGVPECVEITLDMGPAGGTPSPNNSQLFINDVLVGYRTVTQTADIQYMALQLYHGGTIVPSKTIHAYIGACAISDGAHIGMPMELRSGTSVLVPVGAPGGPTPTPAPAPTVPAWRKGLPLGKLSPIAGSSMSALSNTAAVQVSAWCGVAQGATRWTAAIGEGHTDGTDNGVRQIDFGADAPVWKLLHARTPLAQVQPDMVGGMGQEAYYLDGQPAATHTYQRLQYIAARNIIFSPFKTANGPVPSYVADGFDLTKDAWAPAGTYPDPPALSNTTAASVCKHPVTEDVYAGDTNGQGVHWNQATGIWDALQQWGAQAGYRGAIFDVKRGRIVLAGVLSLKLIDPITPDPKAGTGGHGPIGFLALKNSPLLTTGAATDIEADNYSAISYSAKRDTYYIATTDGRRYAINPDTGIRTPLYTANVAVNGIQNRFQVIDVYDCIVDYTNFAEPVNCWPLA